MSRLALSLMLLLALQTPLRGSAGVDFTHPDFLSFEEGPGSSPDHYKFGDKSLKWSWKRSGAALSLKHDVPYRSVNPNPEETSVSTFVFWVYSPKAQEGELEVRFLKGGRVCCSFPFKLGFTGWRGAWVAFDRDMDGCPEEGMDEIRFVVHGPRRGTLYFDGVIPSAFEDVRHHTPDFQLPFVNKGTQMHWLLLLKHWDKPMDVAVPGEISQGQLAYMDTVTVRLESIIASKNLGFTLEEARECYSSYGIEYDKAKGFVRGKPIFFTRYAETFINLGIPDVSRRFAAQGQLLRSYNDNLFRMAMGWKNATDSSERQEFAAMYLAMTRHLLDQGFAAGSGMGTLHHLGYSMRNFYTAPLIMRDVLRQAGLLTEVQKAMEWFSGLGEVRVAPTAPGMDIDAFNTYLLSRLSAALLIEDAPLRFATLQALSRWIDNGYKYTGGTRACFKTDGTVFHHRKAYPAYAVGGFDGAVKAIWLLHGTPFAISRESHENMKRALLEMRFYCNLASFPLAMSGRHPDGLGSLVPAQYAMLADAGSPDGAETIDRELAAAYLRLGQVKKSWEDKFFAFGVEAEPSPTGVHTYGYNCSLSARQEDWLVTIAGHSRYLWATETYQGANLYGRYLTHGSMQIIGDKTAPGGDGAHISALGSGYQVDGFDWCHVPGTTAAVIPLEKMCAHIINPDEYSGYEEMLLSDEWFAGSVGHGDCGVFAMKLHENDKYNGSMRANKSFFVFGNRIVCLGSDISSAITPVHTTLYQNAVPEGEGVPEIRGEKLLRDCFGNAWIVAKGQTCRSVTLQHSYHEETSAPTSGWFEKAWIEDGGDGGYEYLVLVHPGRGQAEACASYTPYQVIARNNRLHAVRDTDSGVVGAAVFETGGVDELVKEASQCILMYDREGDSVSLSVSNPDLALYDGPADEVTGPDGRRIERSVYSRKWIDNDCATTVVRLVLAGVWKADISSPGSIDCNYRDGDTFMTIHTAEARTEHITLECITQ